MIYKTAEAFSATCAACCSVFVASNQVSSDFMCAASVQWAIIAALSSLFYVLAVLYNSKFCRSSARFYSGCAWGLVLLGALFVAAPLPLLLIAAALFLFDFAAMLKGAEWQKNNYPCF